MAMVFGVKKRHLAAALATVALAILAVWLLAYGREQRHLFYKDLVFDAGQAQRLARHPDILYAFGRQAEGRMDAAGAAQYYQQVVARNPLHMDAWLHLADLTAAAGGIEQARRIAGFCHATIAPVVRWKWQLLLLAHGLDMHEIFDENMNFLIARGIKLADALFLLETHYRADHERALAVLAPTNRPAYLQWAIRWQRPEAAQAAWAAVDADGRVDADLLAGYVHYLIAAKKVTAARDIWQRHTGATGMTNPGFETEPTGRGFDWYAASDRAGNWKVERAAGYGRQSGSGLRVSFAGRENVAFSHVRQIVPVVPQTTYRLRFWWKSRGLTTDQTPFVEVYGHDAGGLHARSAPLPSGTHAWQAAEVVFTPPAECHAVGVRLRRLPSRRFDSKIQGSVWLDDFELETVAAQPPPDSNFRALGPDNQE